MKVSVVTPSYNQGRFLQRTLQSVADQQAPGLEIEHVVFDGGSTDESVAVLQAFQPPVRWVSRKDRGQTDAVNQGLRSTDGEVIGWLNSDDIYYPGAIAAAVDFLAAHPEVDVVYGMADHIDLEDRAFEPYPTEEWDFERLRETCFICQPALFLRRSVVERHGLLDDALHYCMDYAYWLRLGKAGVRFAYLPRKLAGSRMYADNKTLGARRKVHREINDMMKSLFGSVPDRWLSNYAHMVVQDSVDRTTAPKRFVLLLLAVCAGAALRWNGRISAPMRAQLLQWGRSALLAR